LIVAIEELSMSSWNVKRENLHYDLYISFAEAVLGIPKILKL
jgi:molecular chaperone DnaJ